MIYERYIGLDVGTKRIGIAVTDPLFIGATPLKTIQRQPEEMCVNEISKLCKEYDTLNLVLGLPLNMDGTSGFQAEDVKNFAALLIEKLNVSVIFEDERLSSEEAERFLAAQNKKPSKNKGLIDMAAAAIILEQYMNRRR